MMWTPIVNTQMGIMTNGQKDSYKRMYTCHEKGTLMFQKGNGMALDSNLYS